MRARSPTDPAAGRGRRAQRGLPRPARGWRHGTFNGFLLSWDPTITARLRELHESGRVEIHWLTTWTTNADRLLAEPMGLPRGLRTTAGRTLPRVSSGSSAASRVVEAGRRPRGRRSRTGRRIVWIDDDLAQQAADTGEWLAANAHVLVIARTPSSAHARASWTGGGLARGRGATAGGDRDPGHLQERWIRGHAAPWLSASPTLSAEREAQDKPASDLDRDILQALSALAGPTPSIDGP